MKIEYFQHVDNEAAGSEQYGDAKRLLALLRPS